MGSMTLHQLDRIVRFDAASPAKTVFYEAGRLKAQVMGLEPGQRIPPCSMTNDVVFVVLEGEGEIVVDEKRESVRPSSWVLVPKESATRSIEAVTKMTILAMQFR
jgi:quercetin dioxygenase-like cupin family protein